VKIDQNRNFVFGRSSCIYYQKRFNERSAKWRFNSYSFLWL
jgi:hypothetical protein